MITSGSTNNKDSDQGPAKRFGTFEGVFLPNILTIVGVIMYLRQGMVMGEAGLAYGLLIIFVAHVVTITTGLSLSAVSTNMRVEAGGAYYIASRSLGIEWGGCIGIPLAISQTLSIALYTLGFAETLRMVEDVPSLSFMAGVSQLPVWLLGSIALAAMTVLSFKGSGLVLKTQYFILALVALSLVALFAGTRLSHSPPQLFGTFENVGGFWVAFAIFFPAVTGITAGVSLSGDLQDPRRSIPRGTMASVFVGLAVYVIVGVFLCFYASANQLMTSEAILLEIAWRPEPVLAGMWAATISSGLGMILGAPRTIQALANDGILPAFLAHTRGKNQEPVVAMAVGLLIAEAAILMGDLNMVAPVLSMFFLATYGTLNLIAGLESLVDNPSYRPQLKVPWWVSIFGALCCFGVMFLISTPATIAAIVFIAFTYVVLKRRGLQATWGDIRRGVWLSLVRRSLLQVQSLPEHPKNWRPNIMVVGGIPQGRLNMVQLADWMGSRKGLVTLHHVMVGPYEKLHRRRRMALNNLTKFIRDNDLNALPAVDVVNDRVGDLRKIIASQGFGSFQPNTVMTDWDERKDLKPGEFEKLCLGVISSAKTLLVLRVDPDTIFGARQRIDIWADINPKPLPMLLLLGYLLTQDLDWKSSHIHLHLAGNITEDEEMGGAIDTLLKESRIPLQLQFHEGVRMSRFYDQAEQVARESRGADLVIAPFPHNGLTAEELKSTFDRISPGLKMLPSLLMVGAQAEVDLTE